MNHYESQVRDQNERIKILEEELQKKNSELEQHHKSMQDVNFLKNRLKEKEKEVASMKHEFNRHRNLVNDLQGR